MSAADFASLSSRVSSGELTPEAGFELAKSFDFSLFSLEEMEIFEDASWLPDDFYVVTLREWLSKQAEQIDRICAYLSLTPVVMRDQAIAFVDSVFRPSNSLSLDIENVIQLLATGANTREYTNPLTSGLISAETDGEITAHPLTHAFNNDPSQYFQSSVKQNASVTFGLPPFMKISATKYLLRGPPREGGIRSWTLAVSEDGQHWTDVANERDRDELKAPGAVATFELEKRTSMVRFFKLTNKNLNYGNYHSILLSQFDVSGEVQLTPV